MESSANIFSHIDVFGTNHLSPREVTPFPRDLARKQQLASPEVTQFEPSFQNNEREYPISPGFFGKTKMRLKRAPNGFLGVTIGLSFTVRRAAANERRENPKFGTRKNRILTTPGGPRNPPKPPQQGDGDPR